MQDDGPWLRCAVFNVANGDHLITSCSTSNPKQAHSKWKKNYFGSLRPKVVARSGQVTQRRAHPHGRTALGPQRAPRPYL